MNNINLMGRLVRKPELKSTGNGDTVLTSFTLAVRRDKDNTDFIDCTAWKKTAEFICSYFDKGAGIAVSGRLQTRTYQANDGSKRKAVEVIVDRAYFPEGGGQRMAEEEKPAVDAPIAGFAEVAGDLDDLPF